MRTLCLWTLSVYHRGFSTKDLGKTLSRKKYSKFAFFRKNLVAVKISRKDLANYGNLSTGGTPGFGREIVSLPSLGGAQSSGSLSVDFCSS